MTQHSAVLGVCPWDRSKVLFQMGSQFGYVPKAAVAEKMRQGFMVTNANSAGGIRENAKARVMIKPELCQFGVNGSNLFATVYNSGRGKAQVRDGRVYCSFMSGGVEFHGELDNGVRQWGGYMLRLKELMLDVALTMPQVLRMFSISRGALEKLNIHVPA